MLAVAGLLVVAAALGLDVLVEGNVRDSWLLVVVVSAEEAVEVVLPLSVLVVKLEVSITRLLGIDVRDENFELGCAAAELAAADTELACEEAVADTDDDPKEKALLREVD